MEITMKESLRFLLFLITLAVGEGDREDAHEHGPCGKFSTERMLTHVLRHCEKPARDVSAPVSPKCCEPLEKITKPCLREIFVSGAFQKLGINPEVAVTNPERCHSAETPKPKTTHH